MNKVPWSLVKIYLTLLRLFQIIHHLFISSFKKKQEIKVFCIGFSRTGTLSLSRALSILGYRSIHFLRLSREPKEGWIEYIKKCKYDAYSDAPMMHPGMFQKLDKTFPNNKFILTIRDKKIFSEKLCKFHKRFTLGD